jgi:hypothetical protein
MTTQARRETRARASAWRRDTESGPASTSIASPPSRTSTASPWPTSSTVTEGPTAGRPSAAIAKSTAATATAPARTRHAARGHGQRSQSATPTTSHMIVCASPHSATGHATGPERASRSANAAAAAAGRHAARRSRRPTGGRSGSIAAPTAAGATAACTSGITVSAVSGASGVTTPDMGTESGRSVSCAAQADATAEAGRCARRGASWAIHSFARPANSASPEHAATPIQSAGSNAAGGSSAMRTVVAPAADPRPVRRRPIAAPTSVAHMPAADRRSESRRPPRNQNPADARSATATDAVLDPPARRTAHAQAAARTAAWMPPAIARCAPPTTRYASSSAVFRRPKATAATVGAPDPPAAASSPSALSRKSPATPSGPGSHPRSAVLHGRPDPASPRRKALSPAGVGASALMRAQKAMRRPNAGVATPAGHPRLTRPAGPGPRRATTTVVPVVNLRASATTTPSHRRGADASATAPCASTHRPCRPPVSAPTATATSTAGQTPPRPRDRAATSTAPADTVARTAHSAGRCPHRHTASDAHALPAHSPAASHTHAGMLGRTGPRDAIGARDMGGALTARTPGP